MSNKPVKKIIKKGLLLVVPVYLLWFLYIQFMPNYYNRPTNTRWQFIKESLEKKHLIPKSDIIFLGESRVNAGINFNQIENAYSFASGGATSIEMFYILEKYIENYSKPKAVYLSISPRFLSEIFAFHPHVLRNNLLEYSDMHEICAALQKGDTTLGKYTRLKFFFNKLNYIEYYQSDVFCNNVFGAYKENSELIEEMINRKGGRPHPGLKDFSSALNYETCYKHFATSDIITHYFNRILSLCQEEKIELVFFFMPMNESSHKALKPAFIEEYKAYMQDFQKQYPGFIISDSVYYYPDSLFGDESHLNAKGKELFTKQFANKKAF